MSSAKKISLNTLYQLVAKGTNAFSGLLILGLITRAYGEAIVGQYTLIMTYVSLYFIAIDYGANAFAVKQIRHGQTQIFNKLLGQRLAVSVVVILAAIIITLLLPSEAYQPQIKTGIFIILGVIIVQAILATSNAIFQAKENYLYQLYTNLVSAPLHAILVYLTITFYSPNLNSVLFAFLIASVTGAIASLLLVKKYTNTLKPAIDHIFNKQLFFETAPITISMVTNLLYFRIDALIMPAFRTIEEVGRYNIAYRIFENLLSIPTFLGNSLYPSLLTAAATPATLITKVRKTVVTSLIISLSITVIMYILAPHLVSIITGSPRAETSDYLRILSLGLPFFFLTSIGMWLIITLGLQKHLIWIYGISMLLSISLNLRLIPIYGAYASAWTTIALEALVLIFTTTVLAKHFLNR